MKQSCKTIQIWIQVAAAIWIGWAALGACDEGNLAAGKKATASSQWSAQHPPSLTVDGKNDTRWSAATANSGEWLEVDLGGVVQFNKVFIRQCGEAIKAYRIQYWAETAWRDAIRKVSMAQEQTLVFSPVRSSRVRLLITAAQNGIPGVCEFEVYNDAGAPGSLTMGATPQNLAMGKPAAASSQYSKEFAASNTADGDFKTRWSAAKAGSQWVEVDLGEPTAFNCIAVTQHGAAITKYRAQYWAEGKWSEALKGVDLPLFSQFVFQTVHASKVRLAIDESKSPASLYELEVFNDPNATPLETFTPETAASKPGERALVLSATDQGRTFEGIGVLSAGGNTCLLKDYPEPYRSEILDFLFKPKFGAGFQHLKVEIGGGENSTCGSEPSHALTIEERDRPKPRGFEFWLMHEARKRNPAIILDCLPWSLPAWCGGAFTQNSADWFVSFLNCAKQTYGVELDYVGAGWNERGTNRDWVVKMLRPALNRAGYSHVKLQGPDHNGEHWKIFDQFDKDFAYRDVLDAVSYHIYGLPEAPQKAKAAGKPLWMSECTGSGGLEELRQLIRFYIRDRVTKFITWCPLASCHEGHTCFANVGFIEANQPWSGHYVVRDGIWYAAQVTQFSEPGWKFMDSACAAFNPKDPKTSSGCLALRDPKGDQWSVIAATTRPMTLQVRLESGLCPGPVHVWKSSKTETLAKQLDIVPVNGLFSLKLDGESAYSITTTTGQRKGTPSQPIPAAARFPMPYAEDFESYKAGTLPKFFMDAKGTFEVAEGGRKGRCLQQMVPAEGIMWNGAILIPYTIFGDNLWKDYELSADVKIAGGEVGIGGHHDDLAKLGYRFFVSGGGKWTVAYHSETLASGTLAEFDANAWHRMKLGFLGQGLTASIDGVALATLQVGGKSKVGRCFLTSSYYPNRFDNIKVTPLATTAGVPQ